MHKRQETNTSVFTSPSREKKRVRISENGFKLSIKRFSTGIIVGILLTLVTIVLQCVAFFTPHWKEIAPSTPSVYVDGVDALIRIEILQYFNTVHRYSRHSYGLFQRCEYALSNSSRSQLLDLVINKSTRKCTRNYLPSYNDQHFNECHSLSYYRFCAKASERNFDINKDYLRATYDISSLHKTSSSVHSCVCHYPAYVLVCHVIGTLALIFLFLTSLLFLIFPFLSNAHHRLKIKCFAVLASVLSIIFLLIHLIIILQHLEYESIEYLVAIQNHYQSSQIYKLSQDAKIAIDRFLSSIQIRVGYSTILAWIAFGLSFVDAILLIITCKITHGYEEQETRSTLLSSENEEQNGPLRFALIPNDTQPSPLPTFVTYNNVLPVTQNDKYQSPRILNEHEV